ncbi:MAG: BREX-1 system adenine-specific DNA-methyltransferase PglX [Desulfotignum sp.]|nr:BREX-1 system adenine-specific DNA-methyltransferase PglX [Desulfotignum sp.]MCF8089163.1 BREX-1 system adenine-specific DNA-methyltransferase PglX [Desulfotignum sp.]MCF8138392.1 BREX-1 system adenine-specific DNA-methyltransferase PglX [Desulfotignum sp.]
MAFDQSTRNRLHRFVSQSRAILMEEFTRQLQAAYGMDPANGTVADVDTLGFLDNEGQQTAVLLRETLAHYAAAIPGKSEKEKIRQGLDRIIREQSFTVLNRLAALRMAEARGFLIESISRGTSSKGFQLYKNLAGTALGETGDAYRCFLFSVFDEFSLDLAVLFDRHSVQGRLFPREAALLALLEQINHFEIEPLWAEDETIGWIYQYFNSQEERKQMRKASQAPRNSRELAVRNQFFTPRYVVEFLTDNTLGRIWYDMTRGHTALKDICRYLVRRPNEIFLAQGDTAPETAEEHPEELSREELLQQPVHVPFRRLKDPRELRMLDPACGSMHFGLYAFDLFETIYEEAWHIETDLGPDVFDRPTHLKPLQETYAGVDEFKKAIPQLIIEQNIHGVDIDPRAVQIAGLSLWQRAQRAWHQMGIKPGQRPAIRKSNIVCAEPMPGEKELLREFTAGLNPPLLGQLVETIFDKMQLAGEAGTLLKIEQEIISAISDAKDAYNTELLRQKEQDGFLPGMAPKREPTLFDFAELHNDSDFWETAEEKILTALKNYAAQAESHEGQKRLFAEDAAKGFAFIDLCRKRFDVVLMNPPFGALGQNSKKELISFYPNSKNDLLAIFVERVLEMLHFDGRIGAITSRTCFFLSSFQRWRKNIVLKNTHSYAMADFGFGVMDDAMVEAAAYILCKSKIHKKKIGKSIFIRLLEDKNKESNLYESCKAFRESKEDNKIFQVDPNSFKFVPGAPFAYWVSNDLHKIFKSYEKFETDGRFVKHGLTTGNDERFLRTWWEVKPNEGWLPFAKGGSHSPYYSDQQLLLNWLNNGEELRAGYETKMIPGTRLDGNQYFGHVGITWPLRARSFSPHILPKGSSFSARGYCAFLPEGDELAALSVFNSKVFDYIFKVALGRFEFPEFIVGVLQRMPWPSFKSDIKNLLSRMANQIWLLKYRLDASSEVSHAFILPRYFLSKQSIYNFSEIEVEIEKIQNKIDQLTIELYSFPKKDLIRLLKKENNSLHDKNSEEVKNDSVLDGDQILELISWAFGVAFGRFDILLASGERSIPDAPKPFEAFPSISPGMVPYNRKPFFNNCGILPEDLNHPNNIASLLELILSSVKVEITTDIHQCLKGEFFIHHLKTYSKSRRIAPIYWPLSTDSGSYRLWIYYPNISDQTLYTCVNDFVEPKIKIVTDDLTALRSQTTRSSAEEKELARLSDLEGELKNFRDELLRIAGFWKPDLKDGVQITAAPLWKLFQHRQWQNKLKDTWKKLETGEYDWAHLACSIWPERVLRKCHSDRSLAIAHDVETDFWEEMEVPVIRRGKDTGKTKLEWQPKPLTESRLQELIHQKMAAMRSSH